MNTTISFRRPSAIFVLLAMCLALGATARVERAAVAATAPVLRIAGPTGEGTPVVNERGKARLSVVDVDNQPVLVQSWSSDSPDVAKVTRKGVLKGRQYGFATVTARTATGEVTGFVVVVRVSDRPGARAQGDTKEDRSGNVYLSSPKQNVIYRTAGGRDEPFVGQAGRPGYEDGQGEDALFHTPTGLGIDNRAEGGLYVADTANHCIRRVDFGGRATTVLGRPLSAGTMALDVTRLGDAEMTGPRGVASVGRNFFFTDTGNHAIYYADFARDEVQLVAGQPGESGLSNGRGREARFSDPSGLAINTRGDLLAVADTDNGAVRLVEIARTPDGRVVGEVTTLGQASSARGARIAEQWLGDRGEDAIAFDRPTSVSLDGIENVYVIDAAGASVVTRAVGQLPEKQNLAQAGSLGTPASVSVSGTRTLVLDESATSAARAVKTVEAGPPAITSLSTNVDAVTGGAVVFVQGRNFAPGSKLTLGDSEVTSYQVLAARLIRFVVPPQRAAGARTLSVLTRGGVAQTLFNIRPRTLDELAVGQITTVAGGGLPYRGDGRRVGGDGVSVSPTDVAIDGVGNTYVADEAANVVRRIDAATGVITTIVGNGTAGFGGDGGLATVASLNQPKEVAVDGAGNLFVVDGDNFRVRRVDAARGIITTVAGNGIDGASGDGGLAVNAGLRSPTAMAINSTGDLFISGAFVQGIRRVDAKTGIITTIASTTVASSLAFDAHDRLYMVSINRVFRLDSTSGEMTLVAGTPGEAGYSGDGGPATAARLGYPNDIAIDGSGALLIAQGFGSRIRRVDAATGIITTFAGNGTSVYAGDGVPATSTGFGVVSGITVDAAGDVFIADSFGRRLFEVDGRTNLVSTVAGNGTSEIEIPGAPATSTTLHPINVAVDGAGNLYYVESGAHRVMRVDAQTGVVAVVAGNGTPGYGGDGGPALDASFLYPHGLAFDASGNLYVADQVNNRIRKIDAATGIIRTVVGSGDIGFNGDGGPATLARLSQPVEIAFDAAGNMLIADAVNLRIRRVDAVSGIITTVAGNGDEEFAGDGGPATLAGMAPSGVTVDRFGNIYIADGANNRVRKVDTNGIVTTVAGNGTRVVSGDGGPATEAGLRVSAGIAVDGAGSLFIEDYFDSRVRRVDGTSGVITTAVGRDDFVENTGDGGPANQAGIQTPTELVLDSAGNLYISSFYLERSEPGSIRAVRGIGVPAAGSR